MKKSVCCNNFPSLHLIKSIIFYLLAVYQLPPLPPLKSPKFGFSSQNHNTLSTFFFLNVISQVLSQTRNITWFYFHKKYQIKRCRILFIPWKRYWASSHSLTPLRDMRYFFKSLRIVNFNAFIFVIVKVDVIGLMILTILMRSLYDCSKY